MIVSVGKNPGKGLGLDHQWICDDEEMTGPLEKNLFRRSLCIDEARYVIE
jgi:hypothetical protein